MDRVNPSARSDTYGSRINRSHSPILLYSIPVLSIILGSIVPVLPIASAVPIMPPLGFLMLLSWRMIRPGLFPVWAGFPLGLIDDLFSGQPLGSAMLLWSLAMIVVEIIEVRFPWRSFVQDWMSTSMVIASYLLIAALLSGGSVDVHTLVALGPQILLSVLLFPIAARMVARLDRFRLMRVRVVG